MDPYGSAWTASGRTPPARAPSSATPTDPAGASPHGSQGQSLNHRISCLSDISTFDSFDVYQSAAALQHDAHQDTQQQHAGATVTSAYDPRPPLRGRESLVSLESLVFDESLNAYTKTAAPATAFTTPATTAAPSFQHSGPTLPRGGWSGPASTAEPAPYSAYDSSYGSEPATDSTSYSAGEFGAFTPSGNGVARRLSNMLSGRRQNTRRGEAAYGTILEDGPYDGSRESIDLTSLVQNAAPIGVSPMSKAKPYSRLAGRDGENADDDVHPMSPGGLGSSGAAVDLSTFFGPSTRQDEEFIKQLQKEEASGKLTLGLGAGFGPGTKLTESDLLAKASASGVPPPANSPATHLFSTGRGNSLRRTLSRQWPASAASSSVAAPHSPMSSSALPSRRGTVKALAQIEANRRGEIVEVIMEEEEASGHGNSREGYDDAGNVASKVDLSVVSGSQAPDSLGGDPLGKATARHSSMPLRASATGNAKKTQVFYPQPNWRPFSMRAPYLIALIVLSALLGVVQELVYRLSLRRPLVKFHSPTEIEGGHYFAVKFAPTLVAVTFGVLWQVTDFEVKRLEAFYQMSKENGALADESINVDYVTYLTFFRPFRALYCKHYAVAVSSIASLLAVSLVPTLGAAAIVLTPNRAARVADPLGEKRVIISAAWSRLLTATLFVIAALGCLLFWLLQRRRSGLLSDVKGIAGLASMAVVSHIMTDFKNMDLYKHVEIHDKLKEHRYVLRNSSLAPDDENPVSLAERERYKEFGHVSESPHPLMLRARGCIPYIVSIVLFAALVPVVLFTPANALTDRAPWLLTALAVTIKLGWGGLETSVRMMEPFYILWRRHAPAKTLTLDYTAMPFLWVALQALKNGHLLVFFVGFGTFMTELLTVLVTSLATVEGHDFIGTASPTGKSQSGEETAQSFWLSLGLAMFILAYMGVVATAVYLLRRHPFLPRQPNTIASVLAYIHQSKMLWSFVNTSKMNNDEMLEKLEKLGHTYGLGWFVGRDGKPHCGVDQEELLSSFTLGIDYTMSINPWSE